MATQSTRKPGTLVSPFLVVDGIGLWVELEFIYDHVCSQIDLVCPLPTAMKLTVSTIDRIQWVYSRSNSVHMPMI